MRKRKLSRKYFCNIPKLIYDANSWDNSVEYGVNMAVTLCIHGIFKTIWNWKRTIKALKLFFIHKNVPFLPANQTNLCTLTGLRWNHWEKMWSSQKKTHTQYH